MNIAVDCRMMLALLVVLRCVLSCTAAEFTDGTWIYSSVGDLGRAAGSNEGAEVDQLPDYPTSALSIMSVNKRPRFFVSANEHLQPMIHYLPSWKNSHRAVSSAQLDSILDVWRRRLFNKAKDVPVNPSIRRTAEESEEGGMPSTLAVFEDKRSNEGTHSEQHDCGGLEEYLCQGMNHPLCQVRYPARASTRPGSKCRVVVRCDYSDTFFSGQGYCFAIKKAFPAPQRAGLDEFTYRYNHTVRLLANQECIYNYTDVNVKTHSRLFLRENISSFADNGLTAINIVTEYACADMTPCSNTV